MSQQIEKNDSGSSGNRRVQSRNQNQSGMKSMSMVIFARIMPQNLCLNINLSKIKILEIFKWLKKNNIQDSEMLNTFNCGVGFCLIANKNNVKKIGNVFSKKYKPFQIGFVTEDKSKIKTFGKLQW